MKHTHMRARTRAHTDTHTHTRTGSREPLELRVVCTQSPTPADTQLYAQASISSPGKDIAWAPNGDMLVPCWGGQEVGVAGGVLRVTSVQPPTKKACSAREFKNGLRGKRLTLRE